MGFITGTPIFTDNGWKKIEDISGRDRVLVKNFLGDAEFIQPFALKKRKYNGEVVRLGAKDWSFTVTSDHSMIEEKQISRKFKYMFSEDIKVEDIYITDEFGRRNVNISNYDWYKLVGYVLMRGFIRRKPGKPMLCLFLEESRIEEEVRIIGDILDRIGVGWHVQHSEKTRPKIVVSSRNTLVNRLRTRLGSYKRKEMFLPRKMIYNSTKELSNLLIETIMEASAKNAKSRIFQLSTTNEALIDSLILLGTLNGYSVYKTLNMRAGLEVRGTVSKKDSYIMQISRPVALYSTKYRKKSTFSGYVYEIDLFDGQVYIKEGSMPVWVNPK